MKNKLLKNTFRDLFLNIIIWSVVLFSTLFLAIKLINGLDFQWLYDISPYSYYFFRSLYYDFYINDYYIIFTLVVWLSGFLVILYKLIKKYNNYFIALLEGSSKILDKDTDFISLPDDLSEYEQNLNELNALNKKNEALARENEQKKNDLIVYLAHDLKTPLTSIIGYLSLLSEVKDMPKKQREKYIEVSLDKSYKLEELINELFDIARFNTEVIIVEKEKININVLIEQVIEEFYPLLKENDKVIKFISKEKIMVMGSSNKLARAISNLIKNAIYYSTSKEITIKMQKKDGNVEIIVSNKGKKIPPSKLERIFEKFYRVEDARVTSTGNAGLGLAICKEIINAHGGSIRATSDDEYTKFYVTLPLK